MVRDRKCNQTDCPGRACATLTYDYRDSTVVIGPLSGTETLRGFDMCADHVNRFTAPQGWQVVRLANNFLDLEPTEAEFESLSEGVSEAAMKASQISRQPSLERQQQVTHPLEDRVAEESASRKPEGEYSKGRRRGYFRVVEGEGR